MGCINSVPSKTVKEFDSVLTQSAAASAGRKPLNPNDNGLKECELISIVL